MSIRLYNWTAKRSGAGMSITGALKPESGAEQRTITNIEAITSAFPAPFSIATARDGTEYQLA